MQQQQQQQTETGVNISTYAADKAAGTVKLVKVSPASEAYLYVKATVTAQLINGVPTKVEGAPEIKNINRQSLADLEVQLAAQEVAIAEARAQMAMMLADMNALDAA